MLEGTFSSCMRQGDLLQMYILLLLYYSITNMKRMALVCQSRMLFRSQLGSLQFILGGPLRKGKGKSLLGRHYEMGDGGIL